MGAHVILIHSLNPPTCLVECANEHYFYQELYETPSRTKHVKSACDLLVMVSNVPSDKPLQMIKNWLSAAFSSYKYQFIGACRNEIVLSFGTKEEVSRAIHKINNTKIGNCFLHGCHLIRNPAPDGTGELSERVSEFCEEHSSREGLKKCMLTFVRVKLEELAEILGGLLETHKHLPLQSLPFCYEAQYGSIPVVRDERDGVALDHLVSRIRGISIVKEGSVQLVKYIDLDPVVNVRYGKLQKMLIKNVKLVFEKKNIVLLTMFDIVYREVVGSTLVPNIFGKKKVIDVLEMIPDVVQIVGYGEARAAVLTGSAQRERFTEDLFRILLERPLRECPIDDFPVAYEEVFHRAFVPLTYGLAYLEDLFYDLSDENISIREDAEHTKWVFIREKAFQPAIPGNGEDSVSDDLLLSSDSSLLDPVLGGVAGGSSATASEKAVHDVIPVSSDSSLLDPVLGGVAGGSSATASEKAVHDVVPVTSASSQSDPALNTVTDIRKRKSKTKGPQPSKRK